jgi:hypothetical protein
MPSIAQPTQANAALTTLVDELEALLSSEAASPPRPPAGAQGDDVNRIESRWRRLLDG